MAPYPLPLNKAVLIFFPPQHEELLPPESRCELHVVQVVIKQERKATVNDMAMYFLAQHEITTAVESILLAHLTSPLPPTITIEGKGYSLHGARRQWNYGRRLKLFWGQRGIQASEEKWIFIFDPTVV